MTNAPPPRRTAASGLVGRVAIVLEELSRHPEGIGPREIARETGIDRSAASRILAGLRDAGFAQQSDDLGPYAPGSRLIAVAHRLRRHDALASIARPVIERLRASLNETVSVIVADGGSRIHAVVAESTHRVRFTVDEGSSAEADVLGHPPTDGGEVRVDERADDVLIVTRIAVPTSEPSVYLLVGVPRTRATDATVAVITAAARSAREELAQLLT